VAACGVAGKVVVLSTARERGASDFGLHTPDAICAWIAAGGIEKPEHANTTPWERNPHPGEILVDSYNFFSGPTHGYLAFMYQPRTSRWLLKSLKRNDQPDPRLNLLGDKLRKALAGPGK
jgi:hypothetical protein